MSSRLNVLSITGLKEAAWSEKCGNTLCEKAPIRSALYCEEKKRKVRISLSYRREKTRDEALNCLRFGKGDAECAAKGGPTEFSFDLSQHAEMRKTQLACHFCLA